MADGLYLKDAFGRLPYVPEEMREDATDWTSLSAPNCKTEARAGQEGANECRQDNNECEIDEEAMVGRRLRRVVLMTIDEDRTEVE